MVFLQEAFPGLGESSDEDESGSDEEWESDDGDGEEEDEDEDDEQPAEDDEMVRPNHCVLPLVVFLTLTDTSRQQTTT